MIIGKDLSAKKGDTINVDKCPSGTIEVTIRSRETGQTLKKCLSGKYLSRFVLVSGRAYTDLSTDGVGNPRGNTKLFLTRKEYDAARDRYRQLGDPFEKALWKKIDRDEIGNA